MMRSDDLDRALKGWFEADAAGPEPVTVLATILDATRVLAPRPAWVVRIRGGGFGANARTRPWTMSRPITFMLLLALLVVLAIGAAVVVGTQPTPVIPPVVTGPTLGTDIPPGATSGVIDTPLGEARWVHLTGDASTLPASGPFAQGLMFMAAVEASTLSRDELGRNIWTSPDGLRWTSRPVSAPIGDEHGEFTLEGGHVWLDTTSPGSLWRSTDQLTWEPIDLTGILPLGPPVLEWDVDIRTIASAGTFTAVGLELTAQAPFEGWPDDPRRVTELRLGLYSIDGKGFDRPVPRLLRFEETSAGVRVTDGADGTEISVLDGATLDVVGEWIRTGLPVQHLVARLDGARLVPTSPGPEISAMNGGSDDVIGLELRDPGGPAIAWRLDARGSWTELGPWDIPLGGPDSSFLLPDTNDTLHQELAAATRSQAAGNDLFALHDGPGTPSQTAWQSFDGLHWKQVMDWPPRGVTVAVASGYLAFRPGPEPWTWWTSSDGEAWEPLDLTAMGLTADRWGAASDGDVPLNVGVAGATVFVVADDAAGNRDMLALSFDRVP